jgi:hypothetical protein
VSPFWIAQLVGWALYVLANFVVSTFTLTAQDGSAYVVLLGQKLIKGGIGLAASLLLAWLYLRLWPRRWPLWGLALIGTLASTVLGMVWLFFVRLAYLQEPLAIGFHRDALTYIFALIAWSAIYFTVRYRSELQVETERALRATALAHEARLRMLRYQVNPHFFFNALNSIRALIDESPARARDMVTELSELFRYSLLDDAETTLGGELGAIRNYLAIQKIRFEDRLDVAFEVDSAAEAVRLPSFLVHPLVENAIKYGLHTSPPPLRIVVRAEVRAGVLAVEVRNSGHLANGASLDRPVLGTGTGLHNSGERLRQRYAGRHRFALDEADGWVSARLEIPATEAA